VVGGQAGVARAIELLRAEVLRDLALLGCRSLEDLPGRVVPAPGVAAPRDLSS
jgi:isopentenyl diphosphate isomerase/L-lactate dehydrogenase-like FMN-dependent dehydrogenase